MSAEAHRGGVRYPHNAMSLEDITSDFMSDESDCEAEREDLSNSDNEDVSYLELVSLFNMLKSFDHIYNNNVVIDEEVGQLMIIFQLIRY